MTINSKYCLGIDGGGTKTAFVLADNEGNILRQLKLGPTNPYDVGVDETKAVLKNGIYQICEEIPLSDVSVFAGLAGCKSNDFTQLLTDYLGEFNFACYGLDSDNENIIAAGLGEGDGITVILGTGVCAFAVQGQDHHRIAGWGYLFDEGGSGYNIGRDAISKYYSAFDGSGEETSLVERITDRAGCSQLKLLNKLYEGGKKLIASYAGLVFEEAEKGDKVSCEILRRNMAEVARIIRYALSRFPKEATNIPVVLAGGLTNQPLLIPYLTEALGDMSRCRLDILRTEPVEGALLKAKKLWLDKTAD